MVWKSVDGIQSVYGAGTDVTSGRLALVETRRVFPVEGTISLGGQRMLQAYIRGALGRAHYEILEDDGSYYGEVPGFEGVYANAESLENCREELEEVLEEWILFRVSKSLPLPTVDGIELEVRQVG